MATSNFSALLASFMTEPDSGAIVPENSQAAVPSTPETYGSGEPTQTTQEQPVAPEVPLSQTSQGLKGVLVGASAGDTKKAALTDRAVPKAQALSGASARIKSALDPKGREVLALPWNDYIAAVGPAAADPGTWAAYQEQAIAAQGQGTQPGQSQNKSLSEDLGTSVAKGAEEYKSLPGALAYTGALALDGVLKKLTGNEDATLPFGITKDLEEGVLESAAVLESLQQEMSPETIASQKPNIDELEARQKAFDSKEKLYDPEAPVETEADAARQILNKKLEGARQMEHEIGDALVTAKNFLLNPRSAVVAATESTVDLAVGALGGLGTGVLAQQVAKSSIKKGLKDSAIETVTGKAKKQLTDELKKPEIKKEVKELTKKLQDIHIKKGSMDEQSLATAMKAGTLFDASLTGLSEGNSAARSALVEVENMSHEELAEKSEPYRDYIKDNLPTEEQKNTMSQEELDAFYTKNQDRAKEKLKAQYYAGTFAAVATTAALSSKLTGSSKATGNLLRNTGKVSSKVKEGLTNIGRESLDEATQGLTGQGAQNIVAAGTIDTEREALEGTGEAAGSGAIVGGLAGGAVYGGKEGVSAAAKGSLAVLGKTGEVLGKVVKAGAGKLGKMVEKGQATRELESAAKQDVEDVHVEQAVKESSIAVPEGTDLTSPEGKATTLRNAKTLLNNVETNQATKDEVLVTSMQVILSTESAVMSMNQDLASIEETLADPELPEQEREALEVAKKVLSKSVKKYQDVIDTHGPELKAQYQAQKATLDIPAIQQRLDLTQDIQTLTDNPDSFGSEYKGFSNPQQVVEAVNALSSAAIDGRIETSELRKAADKGNLSPEQVTTLNTTAKALDAIKSADQVKDEVINGGGGNIGLKQYISTIHESMDLGNQDLAMKSLAKLSNFNSHRKARLAAFEKALVQAKEKAVETGNTAQVEVPGYKGLNGQKSYIKSNGDGLVQRIRTESALIDTVHTQLSQRVGVAPTSPTAKAAPTDSAPLYERAAPTDPDLSSPPVTEVGEAEGTTQPITQDTATQPTNTAAESGVVQNQDTDPDAPLSETQINDLIAELERQKAPTVPSTQTTGTNESVASQSLEQATTATQEGVSPNPETSTNQVDTTEVAGSTQDTTTETVSPVVQGVDTQGTQEAVSVTQDEVAEAPRSESDPTYSKPEKTLSRLTKGKPAPQEADADTRHTSENQVVKHYSPRKKQSLVNSTEGSILDRVRQLQNDVTTFNETTGGKLSKAGYRVLRRFFQQVKPLTQVFDQLAFTPKEVKALRDRGFTHKKSVYNLTDENGEFTPETKEIMILSGLEWIENEGTNSVTNMKNNIASLLNVSDFSNFEPSREQYRALKDDVGVSVDLLVNQLGKAAIRNLGIEPSENTPENVVANLETSIGGLIYAALNKAGYVDSVEFPISDLIALGGKYTLAPNAKMNKSTGKSFNTVTSVRLNLDKLAERFNVEREDALDVFANTDKVLSSILSPENIPSKALIGEAPTKDNISRTTSSGQTVPEEFHARAVQESQNPLFLNQNMSTVFDALGEDLIGQMLGKKDVESTIPELEAKVGGKNQTIENDISNYKNFIGRMLGHVLENGGKVFETPFYQTYSFGSQFRMNAQGTDINFQRSKLHRYMIGMKPSTIDLTNPQQVGLFKMVLAQNLDVFDDRGARETLTAFENFINTPEAKQAIATLRDIVINKNQNPNKADLDNLLDVVDQGGEETASLKALVSYMEFQEAKGKPSFETTLTFELDGKSNGPFNALVQIGLTGNNPTALLAGAGLFLDGTESYSEFKKNPANFDFYELVMAEAHKGVFSGVEQKPVTTTLLKYTGTLTTVDEDGNVGVTSKGRKLAKPAVTTTTYAAGKKSIHAAIGRSIKDNILNELQKYQGQDINTDAYKQLIKDINQVFNARFPTSIPPNKVELKSSHQKEFDKNVASQIGESITDAVEKVLPSLVQNSKLITEAGNIIYSMFNAQYNQAFKELHSSLVEQGVLSKHESLTLKQIAGIKADLIKAMPIYNLLQSTDENSGVQTMGSSTSRVGENYPADRSLYSSETSLKKGQKIGLPAFSSVRSFDSPGAGTLAILTQASGDAATMGTIEGDKKALNIFDAQVTSLDDIGTVTNQLNTSGFDALHQFDMLGSVADRFSTSLDMLLPSLDSLSDQELLPLRKEAFNQLNDNAFYNRATGELKVFPEGGKAYTVKDSDLPDLGETKNILQDFSQSISKEAKNNSEAKKSLLESPLFFAQFGGIGSGVEFNKGKIVAESKPENLDVVIENTNQELKNLADQLPDDMANSPTTLDEDLAKQEAEENKIQPTTPLSPIAPVSKDLVDLFGTGDTITIDKLEGIFTEGSKLIFDAVRKVLPNDYPITMLSGNRTVDIQTPQDGKVSSDLYLGFYDAEKGVFINGIDKPNPGMEKETLLHELVHAATEDKIAKYHERKGLPVEERKILSDLNQLRLRLQQELKPTPKSNMDYALFNLSEFLAWGMTNNEVQKVLDQTKVTPSRVRRLTKAAKAIVSGVRQLLGLPKAKGDTALAQLVAGFDAITQAPGIVTVVPTLSHPQQVAEDIRQMDLMKVFDNLRILSAETIAPKHLAHLKDTLQNAVAKVIDPVKLQYTEEQLGSTTEEDMVFARLQTDVRSDILSLQDAGFRMSAEEAMVYRLYSPIVDSALNEFSWDTREIKKLYKFAAEKLNWQSFIDPDDIIETAADKAIAEKRAQARYNVVFGSKSKSKINNSLRNFMALAETNANFRTVLDTLTTPTFASRKYRGDGFVKTISNLFSALMDFINNLVITKESSPRVKAKLDQLALNLRHREATQKNKLHRATAGLSASYSRRMKQLNRGILKGMDAVLDKTLKKVSGPKTIEGVIRIAGAVVSQKHAQQLGFALDKVQNSLSKGNQGFFSSLYDDLKGSNKTNWRLHKILLEKNRQIDQAGKHLKDRISTLLRDEHVRPLTDKEEYAYTKVVFKADLGSLLDLGYSLPEVTKLLAEPAALQREIQKIEKRIHSSGKGTHNHFFVNQAKALGAYQAQGKVTSSHLLLNAESIASIHGIDAETPLASEVTRVQPLIDILATLQALKDTESKHKKRVVGIIRQEGARTDGKNGFAFTLDVHRKAKQNARNTVFQNQSKSIIKGYTKELTSPYKSIIVASASEAADLAIMGYTKEKEVGRDEHDTQGEPQFMYVSEEGGTESYMQGGVSLANKTMKGSSVKEKGGSSVRDIYDLKKEGKALNSLFTANPERLAGAVLVPVLNEEGYTTDYRYLMSEETKDGLLEKDNRFSEVLGAEMASTQTKVRSVDINNQLLKALKEQYDADVEDGNLSRYVQIKSDSPNKKLQEIYRMLPREAKEEAKRLFGGDSIPVRNDLLTDAFGYRKFSVAELWDKDSNLPEMFKGTLGAALRTTHGKRALPYVLKGQRMVQELVKDIKDLIVIKSIVVLQDNIISNTIQLNVLHGVPIEKILKGQARAYVAAEEYVKAEKRIFELNLRSTIDPLSEADQKELEELLDSQQRNPERVLIESGLLQSIIEDVPQGNDVYSYKNRISDMFSSKTSSIPQGVRTAFSEITLSEGSAGHNFLSKVTQLSDFAARSVLYEHLTQVEGKSHDQALQEIVESFVNYDRHLNKGLQYASDMGLVWFPKYFIRMQKVILRSFKEQPARVLGLLMGEHLLSINAPTPIDAFAPTSDIGGKFGLFNGLERASGAHPLTQLY